MERYQLDENDRNPINGFGNLGLISKKANSKKTDDDFRKMKESYVKNKKFTGNSFSFKMILEDYETWTPNDAKERNDKILNWALNNWKFPD